MANGTIVKYKKRPHLNIGVVTFVIIFIYLIFNVFSFLTADHISTYEVVQGTIAENTTYNGLILRKEQTFYSDYSGDINYYLKDASKAGVGTLICSIDESGTISSLISENTASQDSLTNENLSLLDENVTEFHNSFSKDHFYTIYNFKDESNAMLMELLNLSALETVRTNAASLLDNATFHLGTAQTDGIVVYQTDGLEDVSSDSFSPDMLNERNHIATNLRTKTSVQSGDPIYKIITDEHWSIVISVSNDVYNRLAADDTLRIRFKEDNETSYASYTFREIGGIRYMILSLNNSMVRYANERYTEIELILDEQSGLKIPNSSIIEKTFFVIPKEYFSQGGDSSDYGLMKKITAEDGTTTYSFVATELYYETDSGYYISEDDIAAGDIIQMPGSAQTMVIKDTASLQGVYNINKGYSVFKQIEILYQNEEYTIVATGTDYGLSLYDHIALDGSKIDEDVLVN